MATQHVIFREVDGAFHTYLEIITANPQWEDDQIEREAVRQGVPAELAGECVIFGPMAWGREVVEQFGVECSNMYRLHDNPEQELPLSNEMVYAWARALIGLYRTPERNEVFKLVSVRSAELKAVNQALSAGMSLADLQGGKMAPSVVWGLKKKDNGNATDQ